MKIPKKIQIAGRKIDINFDYLYCQEHQVCGMARYRKNLITLTNKIDELKRSKQDIDITFLHELIHWIFHILDYQELREDEQLTKRFSELLYQVLKQIEEK